MTAADTKPKRKKTKRMDGKKDEEEKEEEEEDKIELLGFTQFQEKEIKDKVYNQVYDQFLNEYQGN